MDSATKGRTLPRFPFSTSFQFRDDERSGLEALFERVFFDRPFPLTARQALARTLFRPYPRRSGERKDESPPPAPETPGSGGGQGAVPALEGGALPADVVGDAARHIILCRGANGIGKTRMFRHLRESARARQIPVYEVQHHDVEGIPLKPFLHAIRRILRDHDPGAVLQKKYRSGLEGLMPEAFARESGGGEPGHGAGGGSRDLGDAPLGPRSWSRTLTGSSGGSRDLGDAPLGRPAAPARLEADKVRVFDAITQLLLEVTARKPLLLLLHDLHWSDRATIELLGYIGRNLALRNVWAGRRPPQRHSFEAGGTGPEVEGFENEEWRTLARKSAQVAGYLGAGSGAGAAGGASGAAPARLLVLANYRGFPDPEHYLEQAIVHLGREPFAYHNELRALSAEETGSFVSRCVAGVEIDGHPLEVRPDTFQAIHEASEGFPSFTQELFRALYLRQGEPDGSVDPAWVWSGERLRKTLLAFAADGSSKKDAEEEAVPAGASAGDVLTPAASGRPPPLARRHGILRLRLAGTSARELEVLRVLTVARRPVTASLVARVLAADGFSRGEVDGLLDELEDRGLVEACGPESEASYFFHLWDYTRVVGEGLDAARRRRLHQILGEEFRGQLSELDDENAYEVYYHLYRGEDPRSALECGLVAARRLWRWFALEKARRVYDRLAGLLTAEADLLKRMHVLEETARISLALRQLEPAEKALRRIEEEGAPVLSAERRAELLLLEAEAIGAADPARGLKILGRVPKLLSDENTRLGARLQLVTARLRLVRQDVKRAINFCLKGIKICQKIGSTAECGELYRVLGASFYSKGDYSHAVDNYQRALKAFEEQGMEEESVDTLDELGRVYLERGHHFRAARYLYKSLEIRRRLSDVSGLCRSYDQLALVYLRSGDDLRTIENLNRTLALKERIGDFAGVNPTLAALGDLYQRLGSYEQSMFYFRWEVENSQKLGDTEGLVQAFAKLGRVYFELGDLKQAESLAKQVSILSSEFKLRAQEADGALLEGHIKAFERDWPGAEKAFKLAAEVHGKLGHRRREASTLLDVAELRLQRELFDEALKFASKGQIIADEVKALDLQVRALTLKGNIYRFLKGGNVEKAAEFLRKGVELSQDLSDANVLFDLFYSLAKVCHTAREFAEAANYYGKAELVLKRIGDDLSEDLAVRFFEDSRRKVFQEDVARFRKESLGRSAGPRERESGVLAPAVRDRPCGVADYKDLSARLLRLHGCLNQIHFHDRLLGEALELTGADRGFVLRVQSRQYLPAAFRGFGKSPAQHPEFMAASHIAQESIRKGRTIKASGGENEERGDKRLQLGGLANRSILSVPFMTAERIFGGIYLDKPLALGPFMSRDEVLLESFSQHAAVALNNRREFETAIREPLTGLYTPSYFVNRLREAYRLFNLHGRAFTLLAYHLPNLEDALGDGRGQLGVRLSQELVEVLPAGCAVCWGNPILHILVNEPEVPLVEQIAKRVRERLCDILSDDVAMTILPVESQYQHGAEMYLEARRLLLPQDEDQDAVNELKTVMAQDITLRDAKKLLEKYKIESTLRKTGGNITHAAKELGIHRPQLSNLLKKHDLKRELFEEKNGGGSGG
jgi:tetratricopeptide (TPR) repeat protein/GAF domain-containing protein